MKHLFKCCFIVFTAVLGLTTFCHAAAAQDASATVEMTNDMKYEPHMVTITAGDTIEWKNTSFAMHTVTADETKANDPDHVKLPPEAEPFDSGSISPNDSYSRSFTVPGHYRYFCIPHEAMGMIGEIEVKPAQ